MELKPKSTKDVCRDAAARNVPRAPRGAEFGKEDFERAAAWETVHNFGCV